MSEATGERKEGARADSGEPRRRIAEAHDGEYRTALESRQLSPLDQGRTMANLYESDTTQFIREFLKNHPEVVEKQKQARATWWDKPFDAEQRKANEESRVPKKPYEYYSEDR